MKTNRKELFDQVWQTPMTKIAKTYGCSDVGLRKVCTKNNIPLPPLGHWQKLQYGKGFTKPPLPNPNHNPEITIDPRMVKMAKKASQWQKSIEEALAVSTHTKLKPITELINLHPAVKKTLDQAKAYIASLEKDKKRGGWNIHMSYEERPPSYEKGRLYYHPSDGCIPIVADFPVLYRALKLLDPLFKALEDHGFNIIFTKTSRGYNVLALEKDSENIFINLREGYSRNPVSEKEKKALEKRHFYSRDYNYCANGILYLEITHEYQYSPITFKDLKRSNVEDQLDLIFTLIHDAPQLIKQEREKRRQAQEERERKEEIRRHNQRICESQEEQFEKAQKELRLLKELRELDQYLLEIEAEVANLSPNEKEVANHWIRIVRYFSENAHPLNKRINAFKKIANEPEDPYKHYWHKNTKTYSGIEQDVRDDSSYY